ncbi:MAG: hypothetical protein RLY97_2316 [Pseudomonadota bacterium]
MNYDSRIDAKTGHSSGDGLMEEAGFSLDGENPLDTVDDDERRIRRRNIIWAVLAALIIIAVWFAVHFSKKDDVGASKQSQAPVVSVISPGSSTIVGTINATGVLAARHEMPVGSVGEGGAVAQVFVDAGSWVRKGQVLAVLDRSVQSEQLVNGQAQIMVTEADARLAQANLDRALKLVDRGFISKADIDRLTALRDSADARVRVSKAQLGEIGARVRRLSIIAPDSGLVMERNIEVGQVVSGGGTVLFRIARGGEMELRAKVSESDLAQITTGQIAQVTPVGSAKSFAGQIWQLAPMIDAQSRQGVARIALAYAPELRSGGFAAAAIQGGTIVAPMLPESALQSDTKGSFVWIVGKNNKAERRGVTLGTVTANGVAIASGLSGSERVVLRAGAFLADGETLNPTLVTKP